MSAPLISQTLLWSLTAGLRTLIFVVSGSPAPVAPCSICSARIIHAWGGKTDLLKSSSKIFEYRGLGNLFNPAQPVIGWHRTRHAGTAPGTCYNPDQSEPSSHGETATRQYLQHQFGHSVRLRSWYAKYQQSCVKLGQHFVISKFEYFQCFNASKRTVYHKTEEFKVHLHGQMPKAS